MRAARPPHWYARAALDKFSNVFPRAKLRGIAPHWPFKKPSDADRFLDRLRKAGVPPAASALPVFKGVPAFSDSWIAPTEIEGATTIDATSAKTLLDRGVVFVDPRRDPSWNAGHIPGAVHLHLQYDFTEARLSEVVAKDEEVVIYAGGPRFNYSARAIAKAVSWGFKQVYFFREGLPGWKAVEYPVEIPSG